MLSRSTLSEKGEGKGGRERGEEGERSGVKEEEGEREFSEGSLCAASASSLLVNTGCFSWLTVSLPNQDHLTGV